MKNEDDNESGCCEKVNFFKKKERNRYTTLELIDDFIEEVSKYVPTKMVAKTGRKTGKIKNESLSIILGQYSNFLSEIIFLITNPSSKKHNLNYKFSIERLDSFKRHLKNYLGDNASGCITLIEKYEITNDLKKYSKQQWHYHNPTLKEDYFKSLDTVEKGYWYGFLSADGSLQVLQEKGKKVRYRISFELSVKDKERLLAFCRAIGLNTNRVKERVRENIIRGKLTIGTMAYVEFTCKPMAEDMIKLSFLQFKKGGKINEAIFINREVALGFLLGYFDGDGSEGSTKIVSTNKIFLEQIKEKFIIKNSVVKEQDLDRMKPLWRLFVGPRIFNEMLRNYEKSMLRKRRLFREDNIVYENIKEKIKNKENLQDLVNKYPKSRLAKMFGVSPPLITKLCVDWEVKWPPQGYWNKFRGKNFFDSSLSG